MESENSVVVAAPSVEEAIIIGLTRLTATREEVDIEVLDEGSRGFLGIGSREARVQVTRRRPEAERPSSPSRTQTAEPAEPVSAPEPEPDFELAPEPEVETATPPSEAVPSEVERRLRVEQVSQPEATEVAEVEEKVSRTETTPPREPRKEYPAQRVLAERSARRADESRKQSRGPRQAGQQLDREQLEVVAREITSNMLPGFEIDISLEWVEEDRPTLWISLGGRDADALVGPRARNLHATQYLIRALIYRRLDGDYNVVVDADGYRKRRRRSLEALAESKADRAVELGRTIRLRPMPAHERRIVHITLRQDDRVSTESVGKGRDRAVTIVPKGPSEPSA